MNSEMLIPIINNAALLLAVAVLYDVFFSNLKMNTRLKGAIAGIVVGLIGIALMLNPWGFAPGLFYDTRTILLSIVGLFFGFCPAVIGGLIVISYRIYLGGVGVIVGSMTTVSAVAIGLLWRQYNNRVQQLFGKFDLYALGILVHVVMLFCMLLLPWPYSLEVLKEISLPIMLIYPIGTVLLGSILKNQFTRKRTQESLKENEAKLQDFIDNVPVGMFRKTSDGKVTLANPEMARILGMSTPEQVISSLQDIREQLYVDPNRRDELISALKKNGYVKNFEFEALHTDGKHIWLLLNARTSGDTKDYNFEIDGFVLDITDRKRAEVELQETESKYHQAYNLLRGVLESPNDVVIFAIDKEYRYIAFNKRHQITMEQIWGVSIEVGVSMFSYIKDDADKEKAKLNFDRALAGEAFTLIEEYGDALLERRWYEDVYSPLKDGKGNVIGLTLFLTDITERKKAELALIEAKILAEESSRTKTEFIANMSHELRTPLNSVIGFSQVLLEGVFGDLNNKQKKYVFNILNSGNHLLDVINNILDISKIESGNMIFEPEKIDLHKTITDVILSMELMIMKKSIDFKFNNECKNVEIFADKLKLKQIMYNLLNNAVKFTPKNGKLWIDCKKKGDNIKISVSDSGIGIPANEQELIFDPFKQVSSSSNRAYGGTGLGLSIVKYYVKMHSGEIRVESEVGKGSTFTVTIPICPFENHSL
ncbi:MAG: ATP-binding protein [Methanolobus sp.]|nr:ATP-binding protein [Methanolobus sp.]